MKIPYLTFNFALALILSLVSPMNPSLAKETDNQTTTCNTMTQSTAKNLTGATQPTQSINSTKDSGVYYMLAILFVLLMMIWEKRPIAARPKANQDQIN